MTHRSWLVAAGVAIAVLAVIGAVVAMSGTGPAGEAASSVGANGHQDTAEPAPDSPGPPSSPGEPAPVAPRDQQSRPALPLALPIESYELLAPDRLRIRYANGVPECYGTLARAAVTESPQRVLITLLRQPPTGPATRACPEIALVHDTVVELSAPLGDRAVVDGSDPGRGVVRPGHGTP